MKKIFTLILAATLLMPCLFIPAFADDSITAEEAELLLYKANCLSRFVNDLGATDDYRNVFWNEIKGTYYEYKGFMLNTAERIESVQKFAEKIYVSELADNAWKVSFENHALKSPFSLTEDDLDGYDVNHPVYDLYEYAGRESGCSIQLIQDYTYHNSHRANPYACFSGKELVFVSNGNGNANALVTVIYRYGGAEPTSLPIQISVEFKKENGIWKISGGEFFDAMCDLKNFKYKRLCRFDSYDFGVTQLICNLMNTKGFKSDASDGTWDATFPSSYSTFVSDNYVKYVMHVKGTDPSGKPLDNDYTAYFKSVSESDFKKNYAGKENLIADTSPDGRYLVFYGGGLYDLLVNGNPDAEQYHGESAPYTGDESVKEMIIFTSVAITAACACLCVIRKRKKIEE